MENMMMSNNTGDSTALDSKIGEASASEDQLFTDMAPKGEFSMTILNSLVKTLNQVLPLFSIKDVYPSFTEDLTVFPVDFVKQLGMVSKAVEDATEAGVLDPGLTFSLTDIVDDNSVSLLSGKLAQIAKSKDFKRFLAEPKPKTEPVAEGVTGGETQSMNDQSMNDLLMNRMK